MKVLVKGDRACDQRCYDARRLGCSCVCGGANHGLGLEHATERHAATADDAGDARAALEARGARSGRSSSADLAAAVAQVRQALRTNVKFGAVEKRGQRS